AFSGVTPATATRGDYSHDVAILQFEVIPKRRDVPFLRCAGVDHEVATLASFPAFDTPGGAFHTVHACAQDGLGSEHAHVADHASATAEGAWTTAVLVDGVVENLHGEFALDELDWEIFLATCRVDDVQAITEGTCALTDANAVDEQRERATLGIEGAQHVDDVVASPGWGCPSSRLRKIAHNAVEHTIQGVGPQAERRRVTRLYQAARAE